MQDGHFVVSHACLAKEVSSRPLLATYVGGMDGRTLCPLHHRKMIILHRMGNEL